MQQALVKADDKVPQGWATPKEHQLKSSFYNSEVNVVPKLISSGNVTFKNFCCKCRCYFTHFFGFSPLIIEKSSLDEEYSQYSPSNNYQSFGKELYENTLVDWKGGFSLCPPYWAISELDSFRFWKVNSVGSLVTATSNYKVSSRAKGDIEDSYRHSSSWERENLQYNKKTEISLGRIFELGRRGTVKYSERYSEDHPYCGPPILTMSCLGELGRFGNQLFQYIFLKCCALVQHTSVQVPAWIGESLFDLKDDRISVKLPVAVESSRMKANSIFTDKLTEYIKSINSEKQVVEIEPNVLANNSAKKLINVDLWGWFQWHTSYYRPFRSYITSLLRVKPDLKEYLDIEINKKLCPLDGSCTLVGIHIRLGDYKDIAASSFAYCAPVSWYLEWLEYIWPQLENPVLFVASDEIEQVEEYFWQYQPKTCYSLGIQMPKTYSNTEADFFPDWYILTMCDVLAISNSTFSFTSCLLNQRKNPRFYRAHYLHRIIEMNPWNTDPIIHKELSGSFWKRTWDTVLLLYRQQGMLGLLRNIFWGFPLYRIRSVLIGLVLGFRRLYWNSFLRKMFDSSSD